MSFLSRLLNPPPPPLAALWEWTTSTAREPRWYLDHDVADTIDGRFDMVALITSLLLIRMDETGLRKESALLTERFVDDMDGSLRDIGIGDMVVGKHVGRMVGALGGRLGAYRDALAAADPLPALADALARNVYRGDPPGDAAQRLATEVLALKARIDRTPTERMLAGDMI